VKVLEKNKKEGKEFFSKAIYLSRGKIDFPSREFKSHITGRGRGRDNM